MESVNASGKLVIVPTPIGNLGDMTLRSLEALREADVVCAEDTRVTGKLLAHFGIEKRLVRLDEAMIGSRAAGVVERVAAGEVVAYCSDAGMPGVSDPGLRLVAAAREAGVAVEVLPGGLVRAAAGATNAAVAAAARDAGLAGYEFASGIPGTIGGAAIMNAGAYEGQFSDVAVEVRCLVPSEGPWRVANVPAPEAAWGYRQSRMMRESWVVLGATLQLRADSPAAIAARMEELRERRESKQPLEMPSAGSTFKRPEGHFAGALIQEAGCQGLRVGGAQVSTKHAGFVVNVGDATAADVLALIAEVQRRVHETTGVQLEPEVRLWQ